MISLLRPLTFLFISTALVLCGNGLETILLPLRAAAQGFSKFEIGLIGASYWLGITAGCVLCPRVIGRVGHPRAFTFFTAIATLSPLLEQMCQISLFWWIARSVTGFCFSGILTVIESWINAVAPNEQRGRVLSVYTITNFGALMVGQQVMAMANPSSPHLFTVAAILYSLSAVPLSFTLMPPPPKVLALLPRPSKLWRLSPMAVIGCLSAGLANSAFWALAPLYAQGSHIASPSFTAFFMTTAVLGGVLSQYPVGRLSDQQDRRRVLIGLGLLASAAGFALFLCFEGAAFFKLGLGFAYGFFTLPIYWVSVAHANDQAGAEQSVEISSHLLLIFASAAVMGPILGSLNAAAFGIRAIFLYTAIIHALLAVSCWARYLMSPGPNATES